MKMNKVNGSGFPSWLFSRFKRQEEVIPDSKTIAKDFDSPCSIQNKVEIQNDMSHETDTKAGNAVPNKKNSEISMMEFGIDYSEDKDYKKDELEKPGSEVKKSNAQSDNCEASDKITDLNRNAAIPATINDVINIGSGLSNVDPLEILDQLGSIHKKRSKKHKQNLS